MASSPIVVIGCVDPILPAGAWMDRSEEEVVIRCHQVQHRRLWHLRCNGTDWNYHGSAPIVCDHGTRHSLAHSHHSPIIVSVQ